jgi:polysaccharide chain length determinant protein (PEP-CTERM system associated)
MIQRQLTAADYVRMLRRSWLMIFVLTVLTGALAYGVSLLLPNRYKSQTLVLVEQPSVASDIVRPIESSDLSQRLASMRQEILSRTRLEPLIRQFGLYPKDINRLPMEELIARLQKSIEVTPVMAMAETRAKELPGFYIIVTLDEPRNAQGICNALSSMFIEENLKIRQRHGEDTTQFLAQQLVTAKEKLDEQDGKLAAFKSRNFGSLPDDEKTNLNLLTGLTAQLDAANQALARAQQDKSFAESMLAQQLATWQDTRKGHNPETLEQQLSAMKAQLTKLRASYGELHPDVIRTKNDIAALESRIADQAKTVETAEAKNQDTAVEPIQVAQLRAQIHTDDLIIAGKSRDEEQIRQQIKLYQDRIRSSPAVEREYKELTRDYQTALDFYNDLLKHRDQSAMANDLERRQQGEQFRIMDPPNLPDKPFFPNRPLFALGGIAGGLAMGLGIAIALELRNTTFRTDRDVEQILQLPVLAMISRIDAQEDKKFRAPLPPQRSDSRAEEFEMAPLGKGQHEPHS